MTWVNYLLLAPVALLLAPVLVLCIECLAALLPTRRFDVNIDDIELDSAVPLQSQPPIAVLIPAHNEQAVLSETLSSLMPQLCPQRGDVVLVVADNCDDRTAEIARDFGAVVIERTDANRRGKGFALDYGLRHLHRTGAPEVLIMIDADCAVHPGAIDALVRQVRVTGRPAQACYLMDSPRSAGARELVSALAFLVKNLVRPRGLVRLNMPCLFTGTGMAFPWQVAARMIADGKLASGNIVEDMQLGLDLAMENCAPLFCAGARVTGRLPTQDRIAYGQRTRWEHGHLQTLLSQVPRLFKSGIRKRRPQAVSLSVELAVPPLALLMMLLIAATLSMTAAALLGASWLPAKLLGGAISAVALCLFLSWVRFGRDSLPLTALLAAPFYMAWKVPMYLAFMFRRQKEWNRTARAEPAMSTSRAKAAVASHWESVGAPGSGEYEMPPVGVEAGDNLNIDIEAASANPPADSPIELAGLAMTADASVEHILRKLHDGKGGMAVFATVEHLQWCARDRAFAELMSSVDLIVAGRRLSSGVEGTPLAAPLAAAGSLVWNLCGAAANHDYSVMLLGDHFELTAEATAALKVHCPPLKLLGSYDAPNGFDSEQEALQHVVRSVARVKPDIVLVALGTPQQERLIANLRGSLPGTWWLTVGSNFGFLCEDTRRRTLQARGSPPTDDSDTPTTDLGQLPFDASPLGGPTGRQVARMLSKSAGHEKQLLRSLESGIEHVVIADANRNQDLLPQENQAAGPGLVYQSFLQGFAGMMGDASPQRLSADLHPHIHERSGLSKLRGLVLLGGSVRPKRLSLATGRSVLELPLEDGRSFLWHWRDHAIELGRLLELEHLPIRVMMDHLSYLPNVPSRGKQVRITLERDASRYRGTGGVLRDLADKYEPDDLLLVANAAQCLLTPLPHLAAALSAPQCDVAMISHDDATPSGMMLVRCAALQSIAKSGYIDMKEQALPSLTKQFDIRHIPRPFATGLPIRTLSDYIVAIQHRYRQRLGAESGFNPLAEDCRPSFAVVEEGAYVHPSAKIHDAVILRGGRVEQDALVVRSVVGPYGRLRRGDHAVDEMIIGPSDKRKTSGYRIIADRSEPVTTLASLDCSQA